jgi:hypothetical protein
LSKQPIIIEGGNIKGKLNSEIGKKKTKNKKKNKTLLQQ